MHATKEVTTRRVAWVAKCLHCGEARVADKKKKDMCCRKCRRWVPYRRVEWTGRDKFA